MKITYSRQKVHKKVVKIHGNQSSCEDAQPKNEQNYVKRTKVVCRLAVARSSALLSFSGSCLKTGQHSIFVIIMKIKRIIYVCWIPYLLKIL